jgi:hypothetical protein
MRASYSTASTTAEAGITQSPHSRRSSNTRNQPRRATIQFADRRGVPLSFRVALTNARYLGAAIVHSPLIATGPRRPGDLAD